MRRHRWEIAFTVVALAVSLFLRLWQIDVFLVDDESLWLCRSIGFHEALRAGDWRGTYQSEHPGVVTMWLGTLAVPLGEAGEWVELCQETGGDKLVRLTDREPLARLPNLIARGRRLVGETVFDEHSIAVEPEVPLGDYQVAVGVYDPATGEQLSLRGAQGLPDAEKWIVLSGWEKTVADANGP